MSQISQIRVGRFDQKLQKSETHLLDFEKGVKLWISKV
jgi:hypothetical protein